IWMGNRRAEVRWRLKLRNTVTQKMG
ncbi:hypothetical protein VCNHCC008D_001274B, partial [Vibrio cholerae O1 str. NHCC-008D]